VACGGRARDEHLRLRVPAEHADGRRLSIGFTVTLLLDADGRVGAVAAIVRDETEQWRVMRALETKVRDLLAAHPPGTPSG
jgi:hypothetical protein